MCTLATKSSGLSVVTTLLLQDSCQCSPLRSVPGYLPCGLNTGKIRIPETQQSSKTHCNQAELFSTNETGQLLIWHIAPQNSLQLNVDGFAKMVPGLAWHHLWHSDVICWFRITDIKTGKVEHSYNSMEKLRQEDCNEFEANLSCNTSATSANFPSQKINNT